MQDDSKLEECIKLEESLHHLKSKIDHFEKDKKVLNKTRDDMEHEKI
jgi:hypothetical protein